MSQGETSANRAMRLLALVRERTEHTQEPVYVADLASAGGLSISEAQAAWGYLRDHSLIDTFSIPYTARINAHGIDRLDTGMTGRLGSQKADTSVDPLERIDPPAISGELHTVLVNLWRTSLSTQKSVDAPTYREAHRGWDSHLTDLTDQRCIARDGDRYRLTPLGLLVLRDAKADEVIRLGDRVRLLLAVRYRDPRTRREAIGVTALARELGEPLKDLQFALLQLTDALNFWCAQFSTDLSAESAALTPGERVLDGTSVAEVARQLEQWAASARATDLATRRLFREPPTSAQQSTTSSETTSDRWIKWLKNKRAVAVIVVGSLIFVGFATLVKSWDDIRKVLHPELPKPAIIEKPPISDMDTQLREDMTIPIDLCLVQHGAERAVQCVSHGVCLASGVQGLGFSIDKTSKVTAIASCQQACRAEATARGISCADTVSK